MVTFAITVAEDHDDEEWAEEAQESPELEQQLSSMTLSSNTSERSHEERLEMFFNFTEVIWYVHLGRRQEEFGPRMDFMYHLSSYNSVTSLRARPDIFHEFQKFGEGGWPLI